MGRLTWLADELRKAGLQVVEVDGWKTRGSTDFEPEGVTWHATAGSRSSSAMGEVGVILNGSETAPAPIAQLMIYRDGVIYVCAAGRCNHNKVGWAGPNEGLGNTRLLGIEMANDNRGEPWPAVQLDAARRATAVIMHRLNADPMRRLAAHYEHQPSAGRPAGETSIKTDPLGVVMAKERPRVAAIMEGEDDMPSVDDLLNADKITNDINPGVKGQPGYNPEMSVAWALRYAARAKLALDETRALRKDVGTLASAVASIGSTGKLTQQQLDALKAAVDQVDEATAARLVGATPAETAALLRTVLGDQAAEVGRILAGS